MKSVQRWISAQGRRDLVSVVVAVFNGEHYVLDALDSIKNNTYRPMEVVIVNDGSTDRTEEVILAWLSSNIESDFDCIYRYKNNGGLLSTRNVGVCISTGEYIQFLDHDDVLHPDKISRCVSALVDADCQVAIPHFEHFRTGKEGLEFRYTTAIKKRWNLEAIIKSDRAYYSRTFWGYLSPVFRRSVVARAGPFPENWSVSAAEEAEFHTRVKVLNSKIVYIDEILALHRVTPASITHDTKRTTRECSYAGILVVWILLRSGVFTKAEWSFMIHKALKLGWRSLRYTQDVRSFLANAAVLVVSTFGLAVGYMMPKRSDRQFQRDNFIVL